MPGIIGLPGIAAVVLAPELTKPDEAYPTMMRLLPPGLLGLVFAALIAAIIASTARSEEHTPELQSLMRISYAVFCLHKTKYNMIFINNIFYRSEPHPIKTLQRMPKLTKATLGIKE